MYVSGLVEELFKNKENRKMRKMRKYFNLKIKKFNYQIEIEQIS